MAKYIGSAANFASAAPTVTNNIFTTDANHVHDQGVAASQWVVDHNLAKKCSVTVVDSAGTVQIGQVTYNSDNRVTIDFEAAFSGKAFFN
jgi:hypothetical protein|tara:strand:+ start:66 stop:335 length:270 start_codon:yes stop_codon:yes gene_type:complete